LKTKVADFDFFYQTVALDLSDVLLLMTPETTCFAALSTPTDSSILRVGNQVRLVQVSTFL
jgi:hypothetical protein